MEQSFRITITSALKNMIHRRETAAAMTKKNRARLRQSGKVGLPLIERMPSEGATKACHSDMPSSIRFCTLILGSFHILPDTYAVFGTAVDASLAGRLLQPQYDNIPATFSN